MYEVQDYYKIIKLYVKDGEKIPKEGDSIKVSDYDEIVKNEFEINILKILKREIINNELLLTIKYNNCN